MGFFPSKWMKNQEGYFDDIIGGHERKQRRTAPWSVILYSTSVFQPLDKS